MCCYFSNGHKCTHPCLEHCGVYEIIDKFENIEDTIWEKEQEILELKNILKGLEKQILQWLESEVEN